MLRERTWDVLMILGWGATMASIMLQALYERLFSTLTAWDLLLLFLVSVLAGMVLVDPTVIVLGYVVSLSVTTIIMFICLTSPALLGVLLYPAFREVMYEGALVTVFRTILPVPLIVCLIAGLIGGVIGERLRLR